MTTTAPPTSLPLVVSADPQFIARAQNWCAAVGAGFVAHAQSDGLRRAWREARFVLIDEEYVDLVLGEHLGRREFVFLIGPSTRTSLEAAVELGVEKILPADDGTVVTLLTEVLDGQGEACVISVMGACGGVGASTLATAIACAAADAGSTAALIDGDVAAGGIELILGAERESGLRWSELQTSSGSVGLTELRSVLPSKHGVDVVSFARDDEPVHTAGGVLSTMVRGYDVVVADVPRHLDALGRQLLSQSVATVLVVPLRLAGVVAAERLIPKILHLSGHVLVVSHEVRGGCHRHDLAKRLGLPVVAHLPRRQRTFIDVEHGIGPRRGAPRHVAQVLLETVGVA